MHQPSKISKYTVFARRIGLVGFAQTAISLKGLIILPILARTLGASDYGIWALIMVTVSLLQPFVLLGLDRAILRFLPSKDKEDIVQGVITVLLVILVTGTVACLILFVSSDFIAITLLKEESAAPIIKIASFLLILGTLNIIALGSFRIFGQIKRYSAAILFQTVLEIGLIAFFVSSGYGLIGALISVLITRAAALSFTIYLIISYAGFAPPDFSVLKPYLKYGMPLIPTLIFSFVIASSDRYVIGFFMGAENVGVYSAAYSIGSIILMFSTFIVYILSPTIFKLYDKGKVDGVKVYLSYSWKYFLLLSIPSAFGLSVLAEPLLSVLTASEFVSVGKFIIPLVSLGTVIWGTEIIFGVVLRLVKLTKIFAIVFGTTAAINLGLNIIFVPHWGAIGAAITTLTAYTIVAICICYKSRQHMKFDIKLGFIAKSVIASTVVATGIWVFNPDGVIKILASVVMGAVIYFSLLFIMRGFEKEELKTIVEIIGLEKIHKKLIKKE